REQREIETELLHVARVGFHPGRVDAERLDARCLELGHLVAHGGELAVSAGGVVSRVEDQRDLFGLQHVGQAVGLAIRRRGGEQGCLAPDHQKLAHEIPLRFLCNVLTRRRRSTLLKLFKPFHRDIQPAERRMRAANVPVLPAHTPHRRTSRATGGRPSARPRGTGTASPAWVATRSGSRWATGREAPPSPAARVQARISSTPAATPRTPETFW